MLAHERELPRIMGFLNIFAQQNQGNADVAETLGMVPEAMEGMIRDGWICASLDPNLPLLKLQAMGTGFRWNGDQAN